MQDIFDNKNFYTKIFPNKIFHTKFFSNKIIFRKLVFIMLLVHHSQTLRKMPMNYIKTKLNFIPIFYMYVYLRGFIYFIIHDICPM